MNYKVVVDAGHGGNDPGAINGSNYEKDFALKVSNYIYDRLNELGVPVYITRNTDETLNRDERIRRILNAFGNNKDVILLSNHINAGGGEGAEVVYALRNSDELASKILNELGKSGQKMRKVYQRRYPTDSSKDYYFIHRLTGNVEPVLIEYGFIDNSNDLEKLQNDILKYGEAVVKAVTDYINVPYSEPELKNDNVYIVKRGDTLYSIANKYGLSVSELKAANDLTSNLLSVNQVLKIPTVPVPPQPNEYITYIVKRGDTLYSISKNYNISVDDLVKYNQLATSTLSVGQKILIPTLQEFEPNDSELIEDNIYIVKSGDTLYSIAKKYNIPIDKLKEVNGISNNLISLGQKLVLPINSPNKTYYVKNGDTLYSIAKNNSISVDELKQLNNLKNDVLSIGQVLILP